MNGSSRPNWDRACKLLGTHDGEASELFIIDLPSSHLARVVDRIARLPGLKVSADGEGALVDPEVFSEVWRDRICAIPVVESYYSLISAYGTSEHLQIYLFIGPPSEPLEVEFVFWNDLTFPPSIPDRERARRLDQSVDLAEDCRRGAPGARCILSSEHNADPRELLSCSHALVW